MSSPEKKKRYFNKFQDIWLKNEDNEQWLAKKDNFTARFNLCSTDLTIKYEGISAIKDHKLSAKHVSNQKTIRMSETLKSFVTSVRPDSDIDTVSELCLTYHDVCHHLSYNSMDCDIKLLKTILKDSKTCQAMMCGRTKLEALAENVLCPLSIDYNTLT